MKYDRMTVYVLDKTERKKWIDSICIELDYKNDKREIHDAIFELANKHEEELIELLDGDEP